MKDKCKTPKTYKKCKWVRVSTSRNECTTCGMVVTGSYIN